MMHTLRCALLKGEKARGMIPSFFETLESPAVEEYKHQQAVALANVIKGKSPAAVAAAAPVPQPQAVEEPKFAKEEKKDEAPKRGVSFGEDVTIEEDDDTLGQSAKKVAPGLSDSTVGHALMGQTFIGDERLRSLLAIESDDDSDDDDDEEEDSVAEAPPTTAKVSKGLFGIKTSTKKSSKGKARMNMKKLGKSVRKLVIKE